MNTEAPLSRKGEGLAFNKAGYSPKTETRKASIVDRLMNEHVPMLGLPQVIVTRWFCYAWLKQHGHFDPKARGFASLDYAAFGRAATDASLTHDAERDRLLEMLATAMEKEAA